MFVLFSFELKSSLFKINLLEYYFGHRNHFFMIREKCQQLINNSLFQINSYQYWFSMFLISLRFINYEYRIMQFFWSSSHSQIRTKVYLLIPYRKTEKMLSINIQAHTVVKLVYRIEKLRPQMIRLQFTLIWLSI